MSLTNEQQQRDRTTTFGGSEMPILMGDSKFTTAWQLLLDKAGIEPLPYVANMYASLGNILEPVVQEKMKITNMDEHEFVNHDYYLPVVAHIDGIKKMKDSQDQLIEIKVSSANLEEAYKQYRAQIQMYLHVTGMKKAELHLLQRIGKIKETFDLVKQDWFNIKDYQLQYLNEEDQYQIENELKTEFANLKILKKDIQVKNIKYDVNYQMEIDDKINIFCKYLEMIHNDPFIDLESLKTDFEREMNGQHELVEYYTTVIEELELQLSTMKEIEKQYKEEKAKLLEFMQENDIKKIDNDKFAITRKAGSERKTFDKASYEADNGEIEDKYYKTTKTKESLLIKLK